jgi:WD repeat-containing protein 19
MTATVTELQSKLPDPLLNVDLPVEPSFVSLGPYHCAAGMNNRAWFFELGQNKATLLRDREYLGTVTSLRLNAEYASVLYEGKIQLHMVRYCPLV